MASTNVAAFDDWIRGEFRAINSDLEARYFQARSLTAVADIGAADKQRLVAAGNAHIVKLLNEGNTDEGEDQAYDLLGAVGLFMAACRRHEITEPSRETTSPLTEASALALHLATSLGVSPRFATAHLTTHNRARDGVYRTFTDLPDEQLFLDYNCMGVFCYMRAADALRRILPLGVSHPLSFHLLEDARRALEDVAGWNDRLFAELDPERFFYCVRPYYKPYRVGPNIYRGANAGDFAGINVIDLLLGLCSADNPSYSQILIDKFLFMAPDEREILKDTMRRRSLLSHFLQARERAAGSHWYQRNLGAFLAVVDAHGHTARQHHDYLVERFIAQQASDVPEEGLQNLTASGPPLPVLMASLEKLRDLRLAAERDDIPSRYRDLRLLRESLA